MSKGALLTIPINYNGWDTDMMPLPPSIASAWRRVMPFPRAER
jgi:hypothetical protein